MNQRLALFGADASHRKLALPLATLFEGTAAGRLDRLDRGERRVLIAPCPARHLESRRNNRCIRLRRPELVAAIPRSRRRSSPVGHLASKRQRGIAQMAVSHAVDETGAQGISRSDRFSRNHHIDGLLDADEPRKALCPFGPGNDAQRDLGQSQTRVGRRNPVVPGHRDFHSASERCAVERHHDGLGAVLNLRHERVEIRQRRAFVPCRPFQLFDVGARDERSASADDDDRANACVTVGRLDRGHQCLRHARRQRVDRRVVDLDDRDVEIRPNADGLTHDH
jgi:hypothetical protein